MTNPRMLILETSGRRGLLALAQGESLLTARDLASKSPGMFLARDLTPTLAELLRQQGWSAKQLDALVVSRGPGSYTGLRVGIMTAKTLTYATDCALLGIDTFAIIAAQTPPEVGRVDILADAQKEDLYVQSFAYVEQGWYPVDELHVEPFAEWIQRREPTAWISGPGLDKWEDKIPPSIGRVERLFREPTVESLHRLGLARYRAEQRDDPFTLEPLYLRASSAERQWRDRTP